MRIEVVGRSVEITDPIREHAEQKLGKLPKYFDGTQQITLTLAHQNHHGRDEYEAEVVVDVEKHDNIVSHAKGDDIYALIESVAQKSTRQLTDFKERLKNGKR